MSVRAAQALYHRLIPASIRNPIGAFRRRLGDRVRRASVPYPLPPARLLRNVQLTPYVKEYLSVGRKSAESIIAALASRSPARVLDFGCGSARTLRHLRNTGWELYGCDIDADAIAWSRSALPFARFDVNGAEPPLPYAGALFDAVYTISVFTHFPPGQQERWAAEMARVLRTGGTLVVSSVGFTALQAFAGSAENLAQLEAEGTLFIRGTEEFNASGMYHARAGLERLFGPHFTMDVHEERGLDGFQDLTIFTRR